MHSITSSKEQPSTIDESITVSVFPSFHRFHAYTKQESEVSTLSFLSPYLSFIELFKSLCRNM
jgi:hypothetical protein